MSDSASLVSVRQLTAASFQKFVSRVFTSAQSAKVSLAPSMTSTSFVPMTKLLVGLLLKLVAGGLSACLAYYFGFLLTYIIKQRKSKLSLPPGPLPLPVIGSLHLMASEFNPDGNPAVHKVLQNIGKKYNGLFGLYLGAVYTVVITHPAVAEEAFTVHETHTGYSPKGTLTTDRAKNQSSGGHHVETMKRFTRDGQGIAMSTGPYWVKVRGRTVANITNKIIAEKNVHIVAEEVQSVLAHWSRKISRGESIDDLLLQLKRESLNIGFRMLFSKRFGTDSEECKVIADLISYFFHNLASGNPADVMPIFNYVPNKFLTLFQEQVDIRDRVIKKIVNERRESFDKLREEGKLKDRSEARDICDMFLFDQVLGFDMKLEDGTYKHTKLTQDEVEICMWDIIFAFGDTTAATNQNFIYFMINYPEVQKKIHEELDRVVGPNRLPNLNDKPNLPYFWAALKEIFRIKLVSPLMAPHYAVKDMTLHDSKGTEHFIPKGTSMFLHGHSMALDDKFWKNPNEFNPDRWFEKENESLDLYGQEKRAKTEDYKFVPFSLGPRMCPGYAFAKVAQFLQTATIMHCLKWTLSPNAEKLNSQLSKSHLINGKLDTTENFGLSNFMINHSEVGLISAEKRLPLRLCRSQPGDIDFENTFLDKEIKKTVKLLKRTNLSSDTAVLTFCLGDAKRTLGLPVGKHFKIEMENDLKSSKFGHWNNKEDPEHTVDKIVRNYTPTSSNEDAGHVDLLVKFYLPNSIFPDGGKMSRKLHELQIGDEILISGPFGRLEYLGRGKFKYGSKILNKSKVGMLAAGSGLTPMIQILRHALKDPEDKTEFSLIYANQTENDILLREELDLINVKNEKGQKEKQIKVHYTLDRPNERWSYSKGFISEEMIKEHMPLPSDDTIILMCGPPPMIKFACRANLDKLGYSKEIQIEF